MVGGIANAIGMAIADIIIPLIVSDSSQVSLGVRNTVLILSHNFEIVSCYSLYHHWYHTPCLLYSKKT